MLHGRLNGTAERAVEFWFGTPHPKSALVHTGGWFFKTKFLYISALLVMVLGGSITIRRERREYFWRLVSFPSIFPLVFYITLGRDFHRFPIDPVLAVIAVYRDRPSRHRPILRRTGCEMNCLSGSDEVQMRFREFTFAALFCYFITSWRDDYVSPDARSGFERTLGDVRFSPNKKERFRMPGSGRQKRFSIFPRSCDKQILTGALEKRPKGIWGLRSLVT